MSDRDPFAGMGIGVVLCILALIGAFFYFMNSGYGEAEKIKLANEARAKAQAEEAAKRQAALPMAVPPAPIRPAVVVATPPPPVVKPEPAKVPAPAAPPQQVQKPPKLPTSVKVELPSGTLISEAMLALPADWHGRCYAPGAAVYVAKYPNDALQGVFAGDDAKLPGTSATLYENGVLQSLVSYEKARRNGALKLWDDKGRRILYVEYLNGRSHGVLCLFKDNMPWLVKEYDKDVEKVEHLIVVKEDVFEPLSAEETAARFVELDDARTKLASIFDEISETESVVKRKLAEWYRKEDERIRQQRAAALSASRTRATTARIKARGTQQAAVAESLWRAALGRSYNPANGRIYSQTQTLPAYSR